MATDPGRGAVAQQPDQTLRAWLAEPVRVGMLVALGVAIIALFWEFLARQHRWSMANVSDWGHAWLVPAISVYLLYQHRAALMRAPVRVFWPALAPIVMGIVSYVFFLTVASNHMGAGMAFVLTIFGVVLLMLGPGVMRYAFFPIGYLLLGVTVSEIVMIQLTSVLQKVAANGSYVVLNIIGITTTIKGNTLEVMTANGPHPLNVAEACSGMRMLIAFIALGTAIALVACKSWWQRVTLVMLAPPLAVLINLGRVVVLGVVSMWDPDMAAGEAHTMIGTFLLIPGFFLYMLVLWILQKSVREAPEAETTGDAS